MKSTRATYDARGWRAIRAAVLQRDGYICQAACNSTARLTAHHIIPRREGGGDNLENLITLCSACHDEIEDTDVRSVARVRTFCAEWHAARTWCDRNSRTRNPRKPARPKAPEPVRNATAQPTHKPAPKIATQRELKPVASPAPRQTPPPARSAPIAPPPPPLTAERIAAAHARLMKWSRFVPLVLLGYCCDLSLIDVLNVLRGDTSLLTPDGVDKLLRTVWQSAHPRPCQVYPANAHFMRVPEPARTERVAYTGRKNA